MPPRLVCLGNLTFDDVVLPDGTERPGCTGGDALYAVLAARLIEPTAEMAAPVGNDFPESLRQQIEGAGLSPLGMPARGRPTLHNRVAYHADGSRTWTLFFDEEAFDDLSPKFRDIPQAFRGAEAFLVLAMTLEAQIDLARGIRAHTSALLALDPQEDYIVGNEAELRALISLTDIYMSSGVEVSRLLGHERWEAAARELAALGPKIVVVKLGAEGCIVFDRRSDVLYRVPAVETQVVDTTGAGDAFCGAFMASLLQDGEPRRAARSGSAAASFAVEAYGLDGLLTVSSGELQRRTLSG